MSKTIILTGASRGIGLAIAHHLLAGSHNLVLISRSEAPLRKLEQQYPKQVAVLSADLSDFSIGEQAVRIAEQRFSAVDGLIVNHGVLDPVKRVKDSHVGEWKSAFDVNFFSAIALVQAALPALRKSKGCILLTSSGAATGAYPTWGAYGAAKAALNHFAMTLGVEEQEVREIREKHQNAMDAKDAAKFAELKSSGGLLKPEQPGHVMAKLVLEPPRELSGKFLTWNAEELATFQDGA
ncbi:hypothetical protein LTR95_001226 [Oleoguttula sp. CCFEE 5521]